jgi:hypothetical protein
VYDDTYGAFTFSPGWVSAINANAYGGSLHRSNKPGSTFSFSFSGTGFSVVYSLSTNQRLLGVYVDGILVTNIKQYGAPATQKVWTSPVFADGPHTVILKHASGIIATVDAIQIHTEPPPAP